MRLAQVALACALLLVTDAFAPGPGFFGHKKQHILSGGRIQRKGQVSCQASSSAFTVQKKPSATPGFFERLFPSFGGPAGVDQSREDVRAALKRKLGAAVEMNQGRKSREIVESILEELVQFQITEADSTGTWRLVWSSQSSSSNPFAKPASVLGGVCFQVVSTIQGGKGRAENIVQWPSLGLTLRGGATLEVKAKDRRVLTIDSFTLEGATWKLPLLKLTDSADITLNDAPRVKQGSQLVTVTDKKGGQRKLNERQGELQELYSDAEGLRVTRGDNGLLYVYIREASNDSLSSLK